MGTSWSSTKTPRVLGMLRRSTDLLQPVLSVDVAERVTQAANLPTALNARSPIGCTKQQDGFLPTEPDETVGRSCIFVVQPIEQRQQPFTRSASLPCEPCQRQHQPAANVFISSGICNQFADCRFIAIEQSKQQLGNRRRTVLGEQPVQLDL
jgi:hypothetical protein